MQKLGNPVPLFVDTRGLFADGGKIYVGVPDGDPETDPVQLYWDSDLTIEAPQPLRTLGGQIVNGVTPASVFLAEADYSMRMRDSNDVLVLYSPSIFVDGSDFQPLNPDLTTISAQANTVYGIALLALANQAALRTAVGYPAPLPAAGGTVTGNIVRGSAGSHWYWVDPTLTSGRVFRTANGASDPTSLPGDVWLEEEA